MSASWGAIAREMLFGGLSVALNLIVVIVPLMIFVELMLAFNAAEKLAAKMGWFRKLIGIGKDALLPLLIGVLMGVSYGAGTLIEINRRAPLGKRDFALIGVFIYACHGIVETSVLFGIAGGNVIVIGIVRLLIATLITMIAARLPHFRKMENRSE
ncbi:MAG: hypothetical protein LBH63_01280 [Clostridiales Family XIII bacterium]|jgi:hypothetical protein|nr:hypothetical protein [Clostridiales Family XIII bacterium]